MHQSHFLLSAAARGLSLRELFALNEAEAFKLFREVRCGRDGYPVCPRCGAVERHWFLRSRQRWRCRACGHTLSVTSGTLFAHHKLPMEVYLGAIVLYTNKAKGISALQMAHDVDVQYKTAFVLLHKVRESLMAQRDETPLAEAIQLDGAYVAGAGRPANRAEDRQDRRLGAHRDPDRRCVLVLRQTPPASDAATGATRTLSFIVQQENQDVTTHPLPRRAHRTAPSEWPPVDCIRGRPWSGGSWRCGNRPRRTGGCGSSRRPFA